MEQEGAGRTERQVAEFVEDDETGVDETVGNGPCCNIDCSYCYYLEKEGLYPDEKRFRMSDAVLERYVRDMIAAQLKAGQREVTFAWQGGEPTLLGGRVLRAHGGAAAAALSRRHPYRKRLQTNGILLDDDWGEMPYGAPTDLSRQSRRAEDSPCRIDRASRRLISPNTTRRGTRRGSRPDGLWATGYAPN